MGFRSGRLLRLGLLGLALALPVIRADDPASERPGPPVASVLEAQVELHRRGFSCGAIDGVFGSQTAAALRAFQRGMGLAETGRLDATTSDWLRLTAPPLREYVFAQPDLDSLQPVPPTWLGKSQVSALGYATALEFAAERHRASQSLLRRLNPEVDWDAVVPGTAIEVPAVERTIITRPAAQIVIRLAERSLEIVDRDSRVVAHCPVSSARQVEKRPVGRLEVAIVAPDPDYTFDPAIFPESAEGQELGRKLMIPPGPNNPVGLAWIGLSRPGYGIHGTPDPEKVGRTESHGCFRLANWDALTLLTLVETGMPVLVDP